MNRKAIQDLRNSHYNDLTEEELREIINEENFLERNYVVTEAKLRSCVSVKIVNDGLKLQQALVERAFEHVPNMEIISKSRNRSRNSSIQCILVLEQRGG